MYRAQLGLAFRAWAWLAVGLAFKIVSPSPEPKPYRAQAWLGLRPGLLQQHPHDSP
ncbi:uncharacterized protein ARMOST_16761 [Armillaria ostoyae]|uniref:Uncharacterized protein n=1 Tax=Armillaria ostoyae TaxID=47428 RepID=A0A284RX39_ARMOS|nr:uncharacterized protein ARMOST_16761 [Armillaria ostoyae]